MLPRLQTFQPARTCEIRHQPGPVRRAHGGGRLLELWSRTPLMDIRLCLGIVSQAQG